MSAKKGGGFDRFVHKKETGAKLKETIRQEKKKAREEKNAFFDQKKKERASMRAQDPAAPKKVFESKKSAQFRNNDEERPSYGKSKSTAARPYKKDSRSQGSDRPYRKSGEDRPFKKDNREQGNDRPYRGAKTDRPYKKDSREEASDRPYKKSSSVRGESQGRSYKSDRNERTQGGFKKESAYGKDKQDRSFKKDFKKDDRKFEKSADDRKRENFTPKDYDSRSKDSLVEAPLLKAKPINEPIPLNKYLAHAGVSSRRDAADIVKGGKVEVNGEVVLEPGFKVTEKDEIKFNGKKLLPRKNLVYILLNKPKDYITTTDDPQGRKTVLDIVKNATTERIYPIGRLDRNTTGVLLLTNDGELSQKLSHPSYEVRKIYEVRLDKSLTKADFDKLINGVTLEDGFIAPDALGYPDPKDKSVIGIEIHSGKNRIVRRIFEHLGYDVRNLDRVMYADLTKKNVDRGKWRFLSEKEVRLLKFLNKSYAKNKTKRG